MTEELKNQIESLLFSSGRKMSVEELRTHLAIGSEGAIVKALQELQKNYDERQSSLMVVEEANQWKVSVREKYIGMARKINPNTELTKSMMETLAVIAWKQPITQAEVISIRTNKAYEHIAELAKMSFLNKEKYGRTYMLKLTQKFYAYFDLQGAQAARNLFKHVQENEETQKKLEEARAAAGIPAEGLSPEEVEAEVLSVEVAASSKDGQQEAKESQDTNQENTSGDTMEEHEVTVTDNGASKEDLVAEDINVVEAAKEVSPEEVHQDAVEEGVAEEEIDTPEDRQHMVDDDEISGDEAGFVQGYEQDADKTDNQSTEQ
jgi:segregation and condensation protein B